MEEQQLPATQEVIDKLMIEALDDSASKDFEFARANLRELISKGNLSLEGLADLAERSQHPRAYEVLAKMIDSVASANRELMDLQIKVRMIKDVSSKVTGGNKTINQTAIFVGSTAQLQRSLKKTLKDMNLNLEDEEKKDDEE